jgi:PAP2 superfamily
MKQLIWVAAVAFTLFSCKQRGDYKAYTANPILYCKTVKKLNDIVLENNFPPMIAARNYAYANIAAYECVAAGSDKYASLAGQIAHMPTMPKPADPVKTDFDLAALLAFAKVGNAVTFPEGSLMDYYERLKLEADSAGMPADVLDNSVKFSDTVVATIMAWSKKDNYAQTRSSEKYTVKDEEGRWVPTPPAYTQAVEPHWMEIRPFVLDSAGECRPMPAPAFNYKDTNSMYYKCMMEVKNVGDNLTDEQKNIADFWDDNPFKLNVSGHLMFATKKFSPAGHWMNIVGIAAQKAKADFPTTVYAYAKTSIALFDGFISCWDAKYRSNYVRPETVINKMISPEWRPYIQTPPFPSYPSGHSVISAAAAEVMTDIFGENLSFKDTSSLEFGIQSRQIESFRKASLEAGLSRLYGGIHYRFDLDSGNVEGVKVGKMVVDKLKMKKPEQVQLSKK